ncbi:uncharacterized protein LOC112964347 [Apteryx rowi]|uniref:uncharacterized protein LOC112964347 n=1 Tax=Apteryx rowi TaxID=308060 RepID=UPI000E1D9E3F|nr:uncharacterized protein LOC112964347 [Apteryx rowi]XP_025918093.1 uncharacterized protein LOC112964347 [Apteryx rowi]XP_025918095.1 uncharacterized protein LOC112964347 [Apteryx rowi]
MGHDVPCGSADKRVVMALSEDDFRYKKTIGESRSCCHFPGAAVVLGSPESTGSGQRSSLGPCPVPDLIKVAALLSVQWEIVQERRPCSVKRSECLNTYVLFSLASGDGCIPLQRPLQRGRLVRRIETGRLLVCASQQTGRGVVLGRCRQLDPSYEGCLFRWTDVQGLGWLFLVCFGMLSWPVLWKDRCAEAGGDGDAGRQEPRDQHHGPALDAAEVGTEESRVGHSDVAHPQGMDPSVALQKILPKPAGSPPGAGSVRKGEAKPAWFQLCSTLDDAPLERRGQHGGTGLAEEDQRKGNQAQHSNPSCSSHASPRGPSGTVTLPRRQSCLPSPSPPHPSPCSCGLFLSASLIHACSLQKSSLE